MCVCVCVHHASHGLVLNVFSTRTPYRSTNAQEEVSNRPIDRQAEGEIIIIYCTLFLPVLDGKKKKNSIFHSSSTHRMPLRHQREGRRHLAFLLITHSHQLHMIIRSEHTQQKDDHVRSPPILGIHRLPRQNLRDDLLFFFSFWESRILWYIYIWYIYIAEVGFQGQIACHGIVIPVERSEPQK